MVELTPDFFLPIAADGWAFDPRNGVFALVVIALVAGCLAKLGQASRGRRAADRAADPSATEAEIFEAAKFGRAAVPELFQALDPSNPAPRRMAAGGALAILWKGDHLVPEEERGLVVRGYEVHWRARRRYPRDLDVPIPILVTFGVPFLRSDGPGVGPEDLEWSSKLLGANRASLETPSGWQSGPQSLWFDIHPRDLQGDGPHRLELHARVRTRGLTSSWEHALPASAFRFEFDPLLKLDALMAAPDEDRLRVMARSVRLVPPGGSDPSYLPIGGGLVIRDPPLLRVEQPPLDLAHRVALEFEGLEGRFSVGPVVASGDPLRGESDLDARDFPLDPRPIGEGSSPLDRPGTSRMRAILDPDTRLGWADPEIRSILPGRLETDWVEIRVIRA